MKTNFPTLFSRYNFGKIYLLVCILSYYVGYLIINRSYYVITIIDMMYGLFILQETHNQNIDELQVSYKQFTTRPLMSCREAT
jgi:hypothetical protein